MISLNCTNCRTVIEMDDGFAGGVCRCKHCGTIQTVPSRSQGKQSSKALYKKNMRGQMSGSGLDQLANAVASSGLSPLRRRGELADGKKNSKGFVIGAVSLAAIFGSLLAWFFYTNRSQRDSTSLPGMLAIPTIQDTSTASPGPAFCGMPIDQKIVIYVLDCGSGTGEWFSYLKAATFKSAESLGRDRKFQIIFWNNGADDAYPETGPTFATSQNVESARHQLEGVTAHGQSDVQPALSKAIAVSPDLIVLATGKGDELDNDFTKQVLQIRRDQPIKIDTFDIGESELSRSLKDIADATGAQAHLISAADLKKSAEE
ncbi:MAG TPA: hypothetical protein VKK61_04125 [Tepidisphaeraceae bacterium]|nr:hypothetical protein [Tepidisphaeraceae bacterium]